MAAMTPTRKRLLILIALVGGVLIAERMAALAGNEPEVVEPQVRARARAGRAAPPPDGSAAAPVASVRLDRLDARQKALEAIDQRRPALAPPPTLFGSVSWAPPPPPPPPPALPPKPVAPPFPYTYMGGLLDDGVRTAFFNKGERVLAVKAGDTVDGAYRVDQLSDKQMQLTYLPLNQTLSLPIGGGR